MLPWRAAGSGDRLVRRWASRQGDGAGLPGAGGLGGVHRCVSGLEQLERLGVVDGIDEGYPDTFSDGEGGVAVVVDGNGCCAVQLVDAPIKVLPVDGRE